MTSLVDLPGHYSLDTIEERLGEDEESTNDGKCKRDWVVSSSIDYTVSVMELKDECRTELEE